MIQSFEFKVGDVNSFGGASVTHEVCFTARARYVFEQLAGYPLHESKALTKREFSDEELVHLIVAGLEGYRVREKARKAPWTVDEVLDVLLADAGPDVRMEILGVCVKAITAAFARAGDAVAEDATGAEGKAQTTG